MANFRKSFNFRNGVQVDEDNFIVSSNGLVGIGTSVPTEFLDVRGSVKIVGLATIRDAFIGVATITDGLKIGVTSFTSGIITASTPSGIVTYYGDARFLQGMPTSQWVDTDVGLGYTSIYASGNVGVGTNDPRFTLQIGGNNNASNFSRGVGISSVGDVIVSGIITANQFYGWGIGITAVNASYVTTGTLDNSRLPSNISISGILTSGSFVTGSITSGNISAARISGTGISITGASVTGVVTATGGFIGNVTGTATTATSLSGSPDIVAGIVTATKLIANSIEVPTIGITTISKLLHVGTSGTAFSALENGRIGVGTALPTSELQIIKSSGSLLEVISNSGESRISIGQSVGVGKSTSLLRFGNPNKTFDIINNDTGNINMYLHAGSAGVGTGRFDWIYGQTNSELMSLTYDGKLGIGVTNPTTELHVDGSTTVTGSVSVGGTMVVSGSVTADNIVALNNITLPPIVNGVNLNAVTGISTFRDVNVEDNLTIGVSIGIGTADPVVALDARGKSAIIGNLGIATETASSKALIVAGDSNFYGKVGIGTTNTEALSSTNYFISESPALRVVDGIIEHHNSQFKGNNIFFILNNSSSVGVGTTVPLSAVDFSQAGKGVGANLAAFMIVPLNTTTQRTGLTTQPGAIIFNTTTYKFQGYTGVGWTDFH